MNIKYAVILSFEYRHIKRARGKAQNMLLIQFQCDTVKVIKIFSLSDI